MKDKKERKELKCDNCQRMKEYQPEFIIHDISELMNITKGE